MSKRDLREGSKPTCPKCHSATASIYYVAVFGENRFKHEGYCNEVACLYIGEGSEFFPTAAILEENQRLAKAIDKWRTLYYEAEEFACSCHEPIGLVCDFHEHHPNVEEDKEVFGLANRAEAAEAKLQRVKNFDWICNNCGYCDDPTVPGKPTICPQCGWNNWRPDASEQEFHKTDLALDLIDAVKYGGNQNQIIVRVSRLLSIYGELITRPADPPAQGQPWKLYEQYRQSNWDHNLPPWEKLTEEQRNSWAAQGQPEGEASKVCPMCARPIFADRTEAAQPQMSAREFYERHYKTHDDGQITVEEMCEFAEAFARSRSAAASSMPSREELRAVCPKCSAVGQLTLSASNTRIHIVCGNCKQWWSIGEIEHTPYFFGGPKTSNGPYEVATCGIKDCSNPQVRDSKCEFHLRQGDKTAQAQYCQDCGGGIVFETVGPGMKRCSCPPRKVRALSSDKVSKEETKND